MKSTRPFTFFMLLWLCLAISATGGPLSKIKKAISKGKYEKAESLILKSLQKDTLNPGARYFYAVIFSDTAFARFDIDSARLFINGALEDYAAASIDHLKKLRKVELTESSLDERKKFITQLAFDRATSTMTLPVFEQFLKDFPEAGMFDRAVVLRDSLAFVLARKQDTWQGYKDYFETYPQSVYVGEATERYQVLIFKDYTKDDRLESYVRFLDEHPDTPFRKPAEEIIFKRSTLDHQWSSYTAFLKKYPKTHLRKKIGDILYYKSKTSGELDLGEVLKHHSDKDSLRQAHDLEAKVLFPVWNDGRFGFWSTAGEEIIAPEFTSLPKRYLCGNIRDEWLEVGTDRGMRLIARSGQTILDDVRGIKQTGAATVLVSAKEDILYHKSGFPIAVPVRDAVELNNGWIAFHNKHKWGIVTPAGHEVLPANFESIEPAGKFIILGKGDLFAFTNEQQLIAGKTDFKFIYDDYEVINDTLLQGFSGEKECLYNHQLIALLPLDVHDIYVSNSFWYKKDTGGYQILDVKNNELIDRKFQYLEVNDGWLTVKRENKWLLISRRDDAVQPINRLDSVKLINDQAAFIKQGDSLQVIFQNGKVEWLQPHETIRVLARERSSRGYLLFSSPGYQKLLDRSGAFLFENKYDEVSLLTDTLFKFKQKNKIGVLLSSGKVLVPAEYDVIDESGGMLFLLKDKKIGGYDLSTRTTIPAKYDARIEKTGGLYQVQSAGRVGLVNRKNEVIVPQEYERFVLWNDTSVWAKTTNQWKLMDTKGKVLREEVLSFSPWLQHEEESFAIILGTSGYGLISNKSGEILGPQYNEILNIGSSETPVIFAEQHLKAAALFVVTYFNRKGEVIRSQAFRPDEYDRIYCDQ